MKTPITELYTQHQAEFDRYSEDLISWNERMNLTGIKTPEDIKVKHFLDSLSVLEALPEDFAEPTAKEPSLAAPKVLDIGTGAGFPGIPLKIVRPNIQLTLMDATRKKTEFLKHIVDILALKNVEILWGRSEEVIRVEQYEPNQPVPHLKQYDYVLFRSVAEISKLVEWGFPFLKEGGSLVAQKSMGIEEEMRPLKAVLQHWKGREPNSTRVVIPGIENARQVIVIKKRKSI